MKEERFLKWWLKGKELYQEGDLKKVIGNDQQTKTGGIKDKD